MKHSFNFQTQYNQFYIVDKENKSEFDPGSYWSEEAYDAKLALANGFAAIGTHSYGNIKGEIELLQTPPEHIDYKLFDNIVEGGINISSGELQILDCPNSEVEFSLKVHPGKYRLRVYGSNFASVKEPDLPHDTDNDFYRIEIWPDSNMDRKILKQHIGHY